MKSKIFLFGFSNFDKGNYAKITKNTETEIDAFCNVPGREVLSIAQSSAGSHEYHSVVVTVLYKDR